MNSNSNEGSKIRNGDKTQAYRTFFTAYFVYDGQANNKTEQRAFNEDCDHSPSDLL